MTQTIYIEPSGRIHTELPKKWRNICNLTEEYALSNGWTKRDREVPDASPLPRTTCTKYELVNAVKAVLPECYDLLRTAYAGNPDLQFYWNTVQEIDRDNADFQAFSKALGITDEQLDAVFAAL